jgi:hypothetical protein
MPRGGTFDHILFCYATDEILYEYLQSKIDRKLITFIRGISAFPDVNQFRDAVDQDEPKKYLVIFDDCLNEINKANVKKIEDYFKVGRKKNITLIFLAQRYYDVNKFVRAQVSYLFLAGMTGRDASMILRDAGLGDMSKEQLIEIFKKATHKESPEDMPFLKINKMVCPSNEKFARNFTDFIPITISDS